MADDHFGEEVAARYDHDVDQTLGPAARDAAATFLADLAGDGRALEFGIGTGRLALALRARGVRVTGIDLSSAMLAKLGEKAGDDVDTVLGDFATTVVEGRFRLVYLAFNTVMNLTTQDAQVACFRNAAAHLEPGGTFVVEVVVPDLQRLPRGETIRPFTVSADRLGFDEYEVVGQGLTSHHFWREGDGFVARSIPFRYAWPAELDLMARLAGMSLRERVADWDRSPFTAASTSHVSVWATAAP